MSLVAPSRMQNSPCDKETNKTLSSSLKSGRCSRRIGSGWSTRKCIRMFAIACPIAIEISAGILKWPIASISKSACFSKRTHIAITIDWLATTHKLGIASTKAFLGHLAKHSLISRIQRTDQTSLERLREEICISRTNNLAVACLA